MSEHEPLDLTAEPTAAEMEALSRLLADPVVWDEPDPGLEDLVVASIVAEAAAAGPATPPAATTFSAARAAGARRRSRRPVRRREGFGLVLGAAAAAALVVVVALVALRGPGDTGGQYLALERTSRAPAEAAGGAQVEERADGTRIVLHVTGLPPAEPGHYYEAWLRKSPEIGVSAGTFHLRGGGDEQIELWAGVSPADYPLFTITDQDEAAPASSGKVLMRFTIK